MDITKTPILLLSVSVHLEGEMKGRVIFGMSIIGNKVFADRERGSNGVFGEATLIKLKRANNDLKIQNESGNRKSWYRGKVKTGGGSRKPKR